jgi:hypothetical protein
MTRPSNFCLVLGLALVLAFIAVPNQTRGQMQVKYCDLSQDCPVGPRPGTGCLAGIDCVLNGAGSGQIWACGTDGGSCTMFANTGSCFGKCDDANMFACTYLVPACKK